MCFEENGVLHIASQTCLELSSTNQHHVHCCRSTVVCTSHIFSRQCRRRNGLQTAKAEKLHCLFAMRYDASEKAKLLARPPHICHMSVTCLADVKTTHNMHHALQVNVSVTCPRPCQSRHAGTRLRAVPASASRASQPKRTKKNRHELALLIVFLI